MAVVADEARVVVVPVHVVRCDVVVVVPVGRDPGGQIGEPHVGIALDAAAVDEAVVPVVAAGDVPEIERLGGGDREQVSHAGIVIHLEGAAAPGAGDLELVLVADVGVGPGLAREEHPEASVGIDPEHRDVGGLVDADVDPGALAAPVGLVPVAPDRDPARRRPVGGGGRGVDGRGAGSAGGRRAPAIPA